MTNNKEIHQSEIIYKQKDMYQSEIILLFPVQFPSTNSNI